ncbi:cytochrome c oxidase assembly protein subunit 15 [Mucilaginibacter frigoritolerans]|uniref:Cytochrome c oxidase assembly protein subunit 15 n=1 Tax=Mucilaginibacter frigoritolerans TaxID=652788 RepID=A0A562U2Q0_9SPHI|nr:COX15/CtaA family protein [Mucilaginibacter frigoritolerans]TWJ00080.1 cytochrome c oxidase assembly protein subunit 15 [Mucilaginibacter frigoritolerans]
MSISAAKNRFLKFNLITIILLFGVILAGGIVRSTGSGMGCPDWPKCFGRYVPPVNSSELPADYKQKYVAGRMAKNQRFAKTLDIFGYSALARRIREDRSILVPEEFNAEKTWTEYINRVIGVIAGIFMILLAVFSFTYRSENKLIPFFSVLNLILVGFQGWLGSIVVSTNLVAWIVTVHMILALAILALAIATYHMAKAGGKHVLKVSPITHVVTLLTLIISCLQIVFGTEVREKIDAVAGHLQGGYREDWINYAGTIFMQHRDIAIIVLIANVVLYALIRNNFSRHAVQQQLMSFTFLIIMLQIVTGILLSYWALPPFAQVSHILLASLIFGAQFYLMLNLYTSVNQQETAR